MKAIVKEWATEIYPSDEEVKKFCRPGAGADTCAWLVFGSTGFQCVALDLMRSPSLYIRWEEGKTTAKRDGCLPVKNFDPQKVGVGEHEIVTDN